jgi:hypothetical protein
MKRFLIVSVLLLGLLISAVVALPLVFKGKISKMILQKANESVDATITYGSYRLGLWRSFPDLTATFSDVAVVGKGVFSADSLAYFGKLSLIIDLSSVFKGDVLLLKSVSLIDSKVKMAVSKDGKVNWDIQKSSGVTTAPSPVATGKSKPLKMLMPSIEISNFDYVYSDRESNIEFSILKASGHLSGDMEGMTTVLDVAAQTPSLNFSYDKYTFLKGVPVDLQTKLLADFDKFEFRFQNGDSKLNNLPLQVEGTFAYPRDSMIFDLNFEVPDIQLKQLFTLIPGDYQQYMKDVDATGKINLNALVKGVYYEDIIPQLGIHFNIANGVVKYPGLPDRLLVDELSMDIKKPEGSMDLLSLGIQNLQIKMANNPFAMHANFSSLFTDPYLDVALKGVIDLETLSKIIPLGDVQLKGILNADALIKGKYSAIEKNDFNAFSSGGTLGLRDFFVKNSSFPNGVAISNASLVLKNQDLQINSLNGKMGKSDFALKGQLTNLMAYVFEDKTLKGKFDLVSNYVDISEFMAAEDASKVVETKDKTIVDSSKVDSKPLEFPKNMEMGFNAKIGKLRYDQIDVTNFNGGLELKNQQLKLTGLTMNMIDGQMKMSGNVIADGRKNPDVDLNLDVIGFDLPTAFKSISMVQKFLPFAEKSKGEFSAALKVKSNINTNLNMILGSITSSGKFSTKNIQFVDASLISKLNSVVQSNKLKNLQIKDFITGFSIKDGNLNVDPFKTVIAQQPVAISGVYNLGGTLNFRVDATLDKEILSSDIQNLISLVPGGSAIKTVDIGLDIKGDAKKPEVKFDSNKIKTQVINQVKNSSKKEIEDTAKKLINKLLK